MVTRWSRCRWGALLRRRNEPQLYVVCRHRKVIWREEGSSTWETEMKRQVDNNKEKKDRFGIWRFPQGRVRGRVKQWDVESFSCNVTEHFSFRTRVWLWSFRLVVGNQNGALYLIGHFQSCVTLASTLHQARVSARVNLESLESQPWCFLETVVKPGYERKNPPRNVRLRQNLKFKDCD